MEIIGKLLEVAISSSDNGNGGNISGNGNISGSGNISGNGQQMTYLPSQVVRPPTPNRIEACILNLATAMKNLDGMQFKRSYTNIKLLLPAYEGSKWYDEVMRIIEAAKADFLGFDVKMAEELFLLAPKIPKIVKSEDYSSVFN